MRKAALLAAGALALPLAVSMPAMAQQSPNAKGAQTGAQTGQQQPKASGAEQQPMRQSQNNGASNQPNDQAAQLSKGQIRQLQQALDQKGFKAGRPDGRIGQRTQQALSKFQKSQNLQQTGQPDDQTLQALGVNASGSTNGSATTGQGSDMDQNQAPASQPSGNNGGSSGNMNNNRHK